MMQHVVYPRHKNVCVSHELFHRSVAVVCAIIGCRRRVMMPAIRSTTIADMVISPSLATLNALMLDKRTLFIADTHVNEDPDAEPLRDFLGIIPDHLDAYHFDKMAMTSNWTVEWELAVRQGISAQQITSKQINRLMAVPGECHVA